MASDRGVRRPPTELEHNRRRQRHKLIGQFMLATKAPSKQSLACSTRTTIVYLSLSGWQRDAGEVPLSFKPLGVFFPNLPVSID